MLTLTEMDSPRSSRAGNSKLQRSLTSVLNGRLRYAGGRLSSKEYTMNKPENYKRKLFERYNKLRRSKSFNDANSGDNCFPSVRQKGDESNYQLWVLSDADGTPYPLIGEFYYFPIIMH